MEYKKSIRLKGYDYRADGYYFVTICTNCRKKIFEPRISAKFGHKLAQYVVAGPWPAICKKYSDTVETNIKDIENKFSAEIDFYCIMPEHIHMVIILTARRGRAATNLSWIINAFKGWCTRKFGESIWQPNYYEHIIRNEKALDKVRKYIENNPVAEKIEWSAIYELENIN